MFFEFYDENEQLQLCFLPLWQAIITLIVGRNVAKHVPFWRIRIKR